MRSSVLNQNSFQEYLESKKPKIMIKKFPKDFFDQSFTLKLRKSVDMSINTSSNPETPSFGRRKMLDKTVRRSSATAMENKYDQDKETNLIQDIIYSSRNIRKLRKKSMQLKQKKDYLLSYELPIIKTKKCPRF